MDIINNKTNINYYDNPYKIWVIDNFLNTDILNKIKQEWPSINSSLWHKGHEYIDGGFRIGAGPYVVGSNNNYSLAKAHVSSVRFIQGQALYTNSFTPAGGLLPA